MKLPVFKTLTDGINLIKRNPIILVPALIGAAISYLLQLIPTPYSFDIIFLILNILGVIATSVFYLMPIRMAYSAATRKKISFWNAFEITISRFIIIILATILTALITLGGFILLIIPGIFLAVKLFFYEFAILIDNVGIVESLKKSWRITKGNWWRVVGLSLMIILVFILAAVLSVIVAIFSPALSSVVYYLSTAVLSTWYTTSFVIAYLRLKR